MRQMVCHECLVARNPTSSINLAICVGSNFQFASILRGPMFSIHTRFCKEATAISFQITTISVRNGYEVK